MNKEAGFDYRIVEYEKIHKNTEEQFQQMVDAIDPHPDDIILDGMDGYGAVSREILKQTETKGFKPEIYTLDVSPVQVERTKQNISEIDESHIIQGDIRETGFSSEKFDCVAIKMGIHELSKDDQLKTMTEIYRILKPGGRFVTWELSLDKENQTIFQDIIRKKDELAGFDRLVKERYFPREDELITLLKNAGFTNVSITFKFSYEPSTLDRKDELVSKDRKMLEEHKGLLSKDDKDQLTEMGLMRASLLTEYARNRIPANVREKMKFQDFGNDIHFEVKKCIIKGEKPHEGKNGNL